MTRNKARCKTVNNNILILWPCVERSTSVVTTIRLPYFFINDYFLFHVLFVHLRTIHLQYTFGVNAWKQWVMTKNAEIEKSSIRRKPFKSEILQLTADELNYSLCLFVKEVRKPNGSEYAPDTIYYLVLGK